MILDELLLCNFGVYDGQQSIRLSPPSRTRNIVLVGGLNGCGKTTLLDALQLVLYGKHASGSNRGSLAYDDYLAKLIHSAADKSEGARIGLQFRHNSEGKEHRIWVQRSWSVSERGGVREHFEVEHNGSLDPVLAEAWGEHVHEYMPSSIANLFLFDGEKIAELAKPESSTKILASGIASLLGLDLLDQLSTDIKLLERRKRVDHVDDAHQSKIVQQEAEMAAAEERYQQIHQEEASARHQLDQAQKALDTLNERFQREGGDAIEQRHKLEAEGKAVVSSIEETEKALKELAAGSAPMLLLMPEIEALVAQSEREASAAQAASFAATLAERDAQAVKVLGHAEAPEPVVSVLTEFLARDRHERTAVAQTERYIELSPAASTILSSLHTSVLPDQRARATKLVTRIEAKRVELDQIERKLAAVPSSEAIASLQTERDQARVRVDEARARHAGLYAELERCKRAREQQKRKLARLHMEEVEARFAKEDGARTRRYVETVGCVLRAFRVRLVEHHVQQIASLVLDSLEQLLRKQNMISRLRIDPQRFALELFDHCGNALAPERLSAGERQLLAVSLLWGLARASGRPLPAVIDTPLGRLDSTHRSHLVTHYFPRASHQVLLLSTDEEINETYYKKLRPHIAHSYLLEFDDTTGSTSVRRGYFW